jgi:hypothetical protein
MRIHKNIINLAIKQLCVVFWLCGTFSLIESHGHHSHATNDPSLITKAILIHSSNDLLKNVLFNRTLILSKSKVVTIDRHVFLHLLDDSLDHFRFYTKKSFNSSKEEESKEHQHNDHDEHDDHAHHDHKEDDSKDFELENFNLTCVELGFDRIKNMSNAYQSINLSRFKTLLALLSQDVKDECEIRILRENVPKKDSVESIIFVLF